MPGIGGLTDPVTSVRVIDWKSPLITVFVVIYLPMAERSWSMSTVSPWRRGPWTLHSPAARSWLWKVAAIRAAPSPTTARRASRTHPVRDW